MELKESVVLYPTFGMGHLIPMIELAKLFINHGFSVTVVVMDNESSIFSTVDIPFISRVTTAYPSISFHRLPKAPPPPLSTNPISALNETVRLANRNLLDYVKLHKTTSNVRAIVVDLFCSGALDVAKELRIPSYFFFASCAFTLAAFTYFPTFQSNLSGSFRDLGNSPVHFPGLPPFPASNLPIEVLDRGELNDAVTLHFKRIPLADGIMINTFGSLEERTVGGLVDGLCVPGRTMPPIYCIGPLIANGRGNRSERHECLTWLDAQMEKSVVFLCFGSLGFFSIEQLKEMAMGLERSGQKFLWVVRSPPTDPTDLFGPRPDTDLSILLPEGFLERTAGQGMVVGSWVPQVEVLAHVSVGGFVSHCGWNSTLEALSFGVPTIAWPLYAEQRINKDVLVEEVKLAVAMDGYDGALVSAEEVERKIRWLMESDEGRAMRERVTAAKESAAKARKEGGSSFEACLEMVGALKKEISFAGA